MAGSGKVGEKIPLAVVGKEGIKEGSEGQGTAMTDEERQTTISQLTENLKALRAQVEQLSGSLAQASGKAVADTAGAATETVTSTVRTYPFYTVLAASAAAFILGRLSVTPERAVTDRAYDRLHDLAARLQPYLMDAMRSTKIR